MSAARAPRLVFGLSLVVPLAAQSAPEDYALVGAGLRARPAYDGAASERGELVPVLRYYGRPWFARTTQGILEGGARTELASGLNLGAQLAYEGGRQARESAFLSGHNLPNVAPGASIGAHLEWDRNLGPMPITLLARGRQNIDADLGAQADLRITAGVYGGGRLAAGVFAQATWANAKSNRSFYGVTPQQSAASGLPAFDPGGGLLFTGVGLLGSLDLSREWVLTGGLEARRLRGGAARSPLAEDPSNYYASAGLAYRF
jgi:MipA family protein